MPRRLVVMALLAILVAATGVLATVRGWLPVGIWEEALAPGGEIPEELPRLHDQVAHLGAENVLLRARLAQYASIKGEGQVPPERVVVARGRIISRTLRAGRRYGELDIGRLDGVEKGMPVADGWALAGTVAGTDDGRCLIQFTSDAESRVAAQVIAPDDEGKPRVLCEGVAAGTGKRAILALEFVDAISGLDLAPGMGVVTAGGDGRLPPGMVLGTITAAGRGGGDHWLVEVKPHRDPELAESLLVLRLVK